MKNFTPADLVHLRAASGWLELGNHREANDELEEITAEMRSHPDVLDLRWQVYAMAGKWDTCLDIGEALVKLSPCKASSWLRRAAALYKLDRTTEARDTLTEAAAQFESDPDVHYDLARYATALGKRQETRAWLAQAFEMDGGDDLKLKALNDPDLERIWVWQGL